MLAQWSVDRACSSLGNGYSSIADAATSLAPGVACQDIIGQGRHKKRSISNFAVITRRVAPMSFSILNY
jgi:hypothetical protein